MGLKILHEQDRVVAVTVYNETFATARGATIGDSIFRIKEYYGEPFRSGKHERYNWVTYGYEDTTNSLKLHFYFDKESDRVIAINLNLFPVGSPPLIKFEPE